MKEVRITIDEDNYVFGFYDVDGIRTELEDTYITQDERSLLYGLYRTIMYLLEGEENGEEDIWEISVEELLIK